MNENLNMTADQYADAFADFFAENEAIYGENVEEAYADFENALNSEMEEDENDVDAEAFANYYADTQDIYGDNIEEAYADFMEIKADEEETYSSKEEKKNKRNQVVAATAIGGVYGASTGAAFKIAHNQAKNNGILKKKIKELQAKGVANLTAAEHAELDDAKAKSRIFFPRYNSDNYKGAGKAALIGGGAGATLGGGAAALHNYSAEDFDNDFVDFYSEAEELYEGNVEEAYADFAELMEEEYGVKDVASKVGGALKKAGKVVHSAGSKAFDKTQKFIHTYIAEPGAAGNAVHHGGKYSDENEETEEEVYSDELTFDEFSDGFAEFYSENEDIYDDSDEALEEAYDDYSDMIADQELELMFSADDEESDEEDREYGFADKGKELLGKAKGIAKGNVGKGAGIGAGAGLAAGLIAGSVGKDAKERRALKAKGSGRTAEETARYNELKKSRRNKIIGGTVAGAAVGAGAGVAKDKGAFGKKKLALNAAPALLAEKNNSAEDTKVEDAKVEGTEDKTFSTEDTKVDETKVETPKEKTFSAVDLIGRPGQTSISVDKTFSMKSTKSDRTESNGSLVRGILGL